jgi:hypothetical protein
MSNYISVLIFLLLLISVPTFAQKKNKDKTAVKSAEISEKKITIQEKIKNLKKSRLYSAEYDKFEDKTIVNVKFNVKDEMFKLSDVFDKNPADIYGIDFFASFIFNGKELEKDVENVVIGFSAISRKSRWLDKKSAIAIVDAERIRFGEGKHHFEIREVGTRNEILSWTETKDAFEKIANAKSFEIRVGNDEIVFKSSHLNLLKNFLSLMSLEKQMREEK